jgi:hypothetical protein
MRKSNGHLISNKCHHDLKNIEQICHFTKYNKSYELKKYPFEWKIWTADEINLLNKNWKIPTRLRNRRLSGILESSQ